jgi:pSer/pThr/pTyr-binding forkhead associated (FHA) protein
LTKPDDRSDGPTTVGDLIPAASAVPRPKKPFLLEQVAGPGAPRNFTLELDETVLGRSLQATISIDSSRISRQHAAVRRDGPEFSITDLNSANGIYLNGVKTHSAILRDGDTVQIGDVVFVFHEGR